MRSSASSVSGPLLTDSVFPESWDDAFQFAHNERITIGTWNINALQPHMSQAIALDLDVLAIQELRISDDTAAGLRHEAKQNGFQFFHGTLPQLKRTSKMVQIDKLVPGVGFLVKDHLSARYDNFVQLQQWEQVGRHCSIQIFINGRWIRFHATYSPAREPQKFNEEILQSLTSLSHEDVVLMGDFNFNTRDSSFVRQFADNGWCPLTMFLAYDQVTFSSNRGTSCIDSIIISPNLIHQATSLNVSHVFEVGHKVLSFTLQHTQRRSPTWEICNTECPNEFDHDAAMLRWDHCFQQLLQDSSALPVQCLWEKWCSTLVSTCGILNQHLGVKPKFRVQDQSKLDQAHQQLCSAMQHMHFQQQQILLDKIHKHKRNQIRKWRNRITGKNLSPSQWMKQLFKWVRGPSLPVPSCIESVRHGVQGFTASLADSLLEIQEFFQTVYNKDPDHIHFGIAQPLPPQQCSLPDIETAWLILLDIVRKADAAKATGMDGLSVHMVKQLPPVAIKCLALVFVASIQQQCMPKSWLDCKLTCIPKRLGKIQVKDLRPLTIAPVAYRLFCKFLLLSNLDAQQRVPDRSIGGVPKRSAFHAWFPAAVKCESTWKLVAHMRPVVQGIAIDTEKFFDNVPQEKALEALVALGFSTQQVAAWAFGLQHLARYVSLNGAVNRESFRATNGVPQGDPLSMIAAAALLGQWTLEIPSDLVFNRVFVDDRLMLSTNNEELHEAFLTTQLWDHQLRFSTEKKTCAFGNNEECHNSFWMNAQEVQRENYPVYLGVPLPLNGLSRAAFFQPVLDKCHIVLDRLIRARVPQYVAEIVIARKILPALTYATSVARPTKQQIEQLRTKIYQAAAFRFFQTQDAHALLIAKTHAFDPHHAMVYQNFCFWRRVYHDLPQIIPDVVSLFQHGVPASRKQYGTITVLQQDLAWMDCTLDPVTGTIQHEFSECSVSLFEDNKQQFAHKIRELLRHKISRQLQQKHAKWDGISNLDVHHTTKLVRSLKPDSHLRVPLVRLLTDAHATEDRVSKAGIAITQHCRFCLHEQSSIEHILWDCPRFQVWRQDWPEDMCHRHNWPRCSTHALICSRSLPLHVQAKWSEIQMHAAQLLSAWMAMCRDASLCQPFANKPDAPIPPSPEGQQVPLLNTQQHLALHDAAAIDIRWKRPMQISQLTAWGGSPLEFNLLFSFWAKWTQDAHPNATPITSWLQAFVLFLSVGGFKAPFVSNCSYIGMAAYKFRTLSRGMLNMCAVREDQFHAFFPDAESYTRWIPNFPRDVKFPEGFLFIPKWNLDDTIVRLTQLQARVSMQFHVNQQCARIPPAEFIDAITKQPFMLQAEDLSARWHIPTFRRKNTPPTWVQQVVEFRLNPQMLPQNLTCITQIALSTWARKNRDEIKSLIARPGKRFIAALARTRMLEKHMDRFLELAAQNSSKLPHLIPPHWSANHDCFCCKKHVPVGAQPWALQVSCPQATCPAHDVLEQWRITFRDHEAMLRQILETLSLPIPP